MIKIDTDRILSMQCQSCMHYIGMGFCMAFPGGIPMDIRTGETSHTEPIQGDNGIQFTPIPESFDQPGGEGTDGKDEPTSAQPPP